MLADRAASAGHAADDPMVLAMLRDFGTPTGVAARYSPPGIVIILAEKPRQFALLSLVGIALQWALTLPRVFQGEQPIVAWWFSCYTDTIIDGDVKSARQGFRTVGIRCAATQQRSPVVALLNQAWG